jgi:hypothetical protein
LPPCKRGGGNIPRFTQASTVRSHAQMLAQRVEMSCQGGQGVLLFSGIALGLHCLHGGLAVLKGADGRFVA